MIGFVVAEMLHQRDPEGHEGGKSKLRARLVAARSLAGRAEAAGRARPCCGWGAARKRRGAGSSRRCGRMPTRRWSPRLYLDGGLEAAARFVRARPRRGALDAAAASPADDAKSALQEALQARGEPVPDYVVIAEEGPDHRKRFRVQCRIAGEIAGEGVGYSKKEAQQDAARRALESVRGRATGGEVA